MTQRIVTNMAASTIKKIEAPTIWWTVVSDAIVAEES